MQTLVSLIPHPASPPRLIAKVSVRVVATDQFLWLNFEVDHHGGVLLGKQEGRRDELWKSTCFELFAREDGAAAYAEFNFAPLSAWAAYCFSDYRTDMVPLETSNAPHVVDGRLEDRAADIDTYYELAATVMREGILTGGLQIGLSAILEETDGTKSYWALRHPPSGPPDFHHPDCFALTLPAPGGA